MPRKSEPKYPMDVQKYDKSVKKRIQALYDAAGARLAAERAEEAQRLMPESDALERLEKWIAAQEPRRHRVVGYIGLLDGGKCWRVKVGLPSRGFRGEGATLSTAIHAALDKAERKS